MHVGIQREIYLRNKKKTASSLKTARQLSIFTFLPYGRDLLPLSSSLIIQANKVLRAGYGLSNTGIIPYLFHLQANKVLRAGYGLTNTEIGQILSWQHGADLSESCRKKLNHRVNTLLQVITTATSGG